VIYIHIICIYILYMYIYMLYILHNIYVYIYYILHTILYNRDFLRELQQFEASKNLKLPSRMLC
jgi:hypothetical protein